MVIGGLIFVCPSFVVFLSLLCASVCWLKLAKCSGGLPVQTSDPLGFCISRPQSCINSICVGVYYGAIGFARVISTKAYVCVSQCQCLFLCACVYVGFWVECLRLVRGCCC